MANSTTKSPKPNPKVGPVFMAGMPGTRLDAVTEALIRDYGLGGIILFKRNIENPVQLAALCNDLQDKAMEYNGTPLFLAVDQEGGPVAKLDTPFTLFPGNTTMGNDPMAADKAKAFARVTAKEMALVGLNMNLAPVVDVRRGEPEKHLLGRTFSDDPEKAALLGRIVVRALQENGIIATAKHFPGLGKTALDPHHHLPYIELNDSELENIDLPPFVAAIQEGVCGIMASHAIYPGLDPKRSATLSHRILTGLLRKTLGFDGLIITDDLEMGAITEKGGAQKGAIAAFEAGADILLICRDQDVILESLKAFSQNLADGKISHKRFHKSLERIALAKTKFLDKNKRASIEAVKDYFFYK